MVLRVKAQVPFADGSGAIAGILQHRAQQELIDGNAHPVVFGHATSRWWQVIRAAKGVWITTGHQAHATWTTEGMNHVRRAKNNAFLSQSVEGRRLDVRCTVESNIGVAQVVAKDHDDIRPRRRDGFA